MLFFSTQGRDEGGDWECVQYYVMVSISSNVWYRTIEYDTYGGPNLFTS